MARRSRTARRSASGARIAPGAPCPCFSGEPYEKCCSPAHEGKTPAPDAVALMRSRYAAYALGLVEYLIATTVPDGPQAEPDPVAWGQELYEFGRETQFLGLEILDHGTAAGGQQAWVRFHARLEQAGEDASFTERSTFVRGDDGRWRYLDGELED